MEFLDAVLLSRIQFAITIAFHIIFPTLSMGLAWFLLGLESAYLITKKEGYNTLYWFWAKIFAVTFGMGVVSGVVLSYQIGTNFGRFSEITGNIIGPLMSYEVMTAFFLEAGFLGIMLFGKKRVHPYVHLFATAMVAVGTAISAFWILAANSWMHTPDGYIFRDGIFYIDSWLAAIFNPSFPFRFAHMMTASLLTASVVVAAVSAWYVYNKRDQWVSVRMLKICIITIAVLAPVQAIIGDFHGLNTLEHQPIKVAAMEGNWERQKGAPLLLFAIPDQEAEKNHFEIGIPKLASFILTHDFDGELVGLKDVAPEDRPPVAIVFWSFRIMVGIGVFFILLSFVGLFLSWTGKLESTKHYLRVMMLSGPLGFIAVIAGWVTTEVGRQPWIVHGMLRTRDGVSDVTAEQVAVTLFGFTSVYILLFFVFLLTLHKLIKKGPKFCKKESVPAGVVKPDGKEIN